MNRVARLCLLVALVCVIAHVSAKESAKKPTSHRHPRRYFHQGESLKRPDEYLDGVNIERFRSSFEHSYKNTRKSDGTPGKYQVGVGIADVTGQIAEIGFMGYAVPGQKGAGILQRTRSRAFIFVDQNSEGAGKRVVYVSIDLCMGFQMVKLNVVERLQALYGNLYGHENVLISGTHSHSGPGGFGGTALVDITTFGFIKENHEAAVAGIVSSIQKAHNNIQDAVIKLNTGDCIGCNANRSPSAYQLDPDAGDYPANTDTEMTVLRVETPEGTEIGMLNFFAVHGTSLNNTNLLVSGDNKGYASYVIEKMKNPAGTLPGQGEYVAAFGQSNLGDVSPNTKGAVCPDGTACDFVHSTCGNPPRSQGCIASGPGNDQYESMKIIGQKQVDLAMQLYESATEALTSEGVDYRYEYFDMQQINVSSKFTSTGESGSTCQAAMGYAFAAGTTDGPGDFDFVQGTTSTNPFWSWVSGFLAKPTPEQIACQAPKPILIDVGLIKPIEWVPFILPEQVYRIGNLWILAVPGEFTTMSGRRLRNMVQQVLQSKGEWFDNSHVVIAGLSNSYSHYITTFEEYQQQRYEAASTLYGPHTLAAHMQNFAGLVEAIVDGNPVPTGPLPMDMRNHTFCFMPGVVEDSTPLGKKFGDVQTDAVSSYTFGEMVEVVFWGASPRNNLQTEGSFLYVESYQNGQWVTALVDGDIDTTYTWARVGVDQSLVTVQWNINGTTTAPGEYRIRTVGVSKALGGALTPYTGISSAFQVIANKVFH